MPDEPESAAANTDLTLEIAHLLLIDVVGYSKLLVDEQIDVTQRLNRIVRATKSFQRAEAAGKLMRLPTGDGMILLFSRSPEEPVRCALELSEALREHPSVVVRMGIHSGPVNQVMDVNDQKNIAGSGINIGQRVMDCGDAGHILVSKHVADDLAEFSHWRPYLHDLGECEVKHGVRLHVFNLAKNGLGNPQLPQKFHRSRRWTPADISIVKPVAAPSWPRLLVTLLVLVCVVAGGLILWLFLTGKSLAPARTIAPEKSIAVLPFENRSEEKANAYFAEGIQDEILTRLSKIADLKVISRTSTQHYKSSPENLREIAKQLGVAHVLEGSVQKSGEVVRVNVQLIKAANDSHLWADTFDRKLTDIFSVESDVAKAVADQLRVHLTGQEEQVIAAKPTDNTEAYDAYLRGLAYTLRTGNTPANCLAAQKYLRQAVRLDPKFALGWTLLSQVDARGYLTLSLQPTVALREEAQQAAEKALTLQPNLGEALYAKGYYHYACLKDYDTAVGYLEQARQLLRNSSQIPAALAYVTRRQGQWDRSESYFNEAEQLDPRNGYLLSQHADSYMVLRRFPEALQKLDQVLDFAPDDVDTLASKAAVLQAEGDLARASALLTPLYPPATDIAALETQVYQAILERRPTQVIPGLKKILARPDAALGFYNGQLRFWLAWAQEVAGDQVAAKESWQRARSELEGFLNEQPDNEVLIGDLALINMGLGDKTAAFALTKRAMATNPPEKDALSGLAPIEIRARVAARMGEPDDAIAALQRLLSVPYQGALAAGAPLTSALLRLDPMFDALRTDPRFQEIVSSFASRP